MIVRIVADNCVLFSVSAEGSLKRCKEQFANWSFCNLEYCLGILFCLEMADASLSYSNLSMKLSCRVSSSIWSYWTSANIHPQTKWQEVKKSDHHSNIYGNGRVQEQEWGLQFLMQVAHFFDQMAQHKIISRAGCSLLWSRDQILAVLIYWRIAKLSILY